MSCIRDLLASFCPEIEDQLKPNLSGLKGLVVASQLPQAWNFKTETESVVFSIDKQGNASVRNGSVVAPDVTIVWKHDHLAMVLRNRSPSGLPKGALPSVTVHTSKGKRGYEILRKQIGI